MVWFDNVDGGTQILGVRGQGSCYYYKLQENDVREIDIVQFRVDVAHMTQSPWLCESAVALNDGSICLWSAHDNRKEYVTLLERRTFLVLMHLVSVRAHNMQATVAAGAKDYKYFIRLEASCV